MTPPWRIPSQKPCRFTDLDLSQRRRSGQPLFHILNDPKNGLPLLVAQPADTDFFDLAPEIPDLLAQAATGGVASVRNARLSSVLGERRTNPACSKRRVMQHSSTTFHPARRWFSCSTQELICRSFCQGGRVKRRPGVSPPKAPSCQALSHTELSGSFPLFPNDFRH